MCGCIFALAVPLLSSPDGVVKCPSCAEQILAEAKVCKHCGRETNFSGVPPNVETHAPPSVDADDSQQSVVLQPDASPKGSAPAKEAHGYVAAFVIGIILAAYFMMIATH